MAIFGNTKRDLKQLAYVAGEKSRSQKMVPEGLSKSQQCSSVVGSVTIPGGLLSPPDQPASFSYLRDLARRIMDGQRTYIDNPSIQSPRSLIMKFLSHKPFTLTAWVMTGNYTQAHRTYQILKSREVAEIAIQLARSRPTPEP